LFQLQLSDIQPGRRQILPVVEIQSDPGRQVRYSGLSIITRWQSTCTLCSWFNILSWTQLQACML